MKFFKNIFSKKKEESVPAPTPAPTSAPGGETFACDDCGQTRPESQKKQQAYSGGGGDKNVCEFC